MVLVSGGEIHSLVTNQEYKRAFDGNMGIIAGAPLGGLVERDPEDQYGLARQLIHPLRPWLRQAKFNGPLQVTAVQRNGRWHVIEYNIRIGVTSGPMILRMLKNPVETVLGAARNEKLDPQFKHGLRFGCSVTLAGYGYPYVHVRGPQLPLEVEGGFAGDVWWNEVARDPQGGLLATGHRIADVIALGPTMAGAIAEAYADIRKLRVLGSYYRTDIGRSLWPPGKG
jgi:phosphoribosylamine-glycine ligase